MVFTHDVPGRFGRRARWAGFTLVEVIGVVALVAVLAAVLLPRVTSLMSRGKVNATAQALVSLRTATDNYLAVNSAFPFRLGTGLTNGPAREGRFDADLVAEGFTEQLFTCPIGSQSTEATSSLSKRVHIRSTQVSGDPTTITALSSVSGGTYFDLDRNPANVDMTSPQMVVTAFIPEVPIAEAIALNRLIDGDSNSGTAADYVGRCLYSSINNTFRVTVFVYISHH